MPQSAAKQRPKHRYISLKPYHYTCVYHNGSLTAQTNMAVQNDQRVDLNRYSGKR